MKIAITGASGLIGSALLDHLKQKGHLLFPLRRGQKKEGEIGWDPELGILDGKDLEGMDAVVHLSGENIGKRWSSKIKEKIIKSRMDSTRLLVSRFQEMKHPPKAFLCASALGYYGYNRKEILSESGTLGEGFLAGVCRDWENAALSASTPNTRVVLLRTGVVLSPRGGALAKMLLPFKLGLGGKVGDGSHFMSWISLEDMIRSIDHCLETESLSGPVNLCAPHPVTNLEFTKALGKALHRPTIFPLPAFIVRLLFGEMGKETILSNIQMEPKKLVESGFSFLHPHLEEALQAVLR